MTESTTRVTELTQSEGRHPSSDQSMSDAASPLFDQLMAQTWTEMEEARQRYNQDAKRLRHWQWWFVGMFTFYTTLVGILLLNLLTGR